MGRAIQMEKDIDSLRKDVQTLKTAFEGLASTLESMKKVTPTKNNIYLHKNTKAKTKELVTEKA